MREKLVGDFTACAAVDSLDEKRKFKAAGLWEPPQIRAMPREIREAMTFNG
jgi:hypothetical protein